MTDGGGRECKAECDANAVCRVKAICVYARLRACVCVLGGISGLGCFGFVKK